MTWRSLTWFLVAAPLLVACSGSGAVSLDAGANTSHDAGPILYGLCPPPRPPIALLSAHVDGDYGYTLPLLAGQKEDITLTVINTGEVSATQMKDLTPPSLDLFYRGGTYPGTGGTCASTLAAGASCALGMTVVAPANGDRTSFIVLEYYNGIVPTTDTHLVRVAATEGAFSPAKHAPLPQVTRHGGPVLDHVHLVTVSFADTPSDHAIRGFGDWVVTSDWWKTVGADYGVGAGTHEHVKLTDSTPTTMTNDAVASFVDQRVASGALPTAAESVYMLFASTATTVLDAPDESGWHNRSPGGHAYAVITPGCSPMLAKVVLDTYTFVAGHELIEAATDPAPPTGYNFPYGEGEVADVCNQLVTDHGYALPTVWSNSAASRTDNPCVPASGAPYVDVDIAPDHLFIGGVPGAREVLTLKAWSTQRVGDWLLQAQLMGPYGSSFAATFPRGTDLVNNGQSVELDVTVDGGVPAGTSLTLEVMSFAPVADSSVRGQVGAMGVRRIPVSVTGP